MDPSYKFSDQSFYEGNKIIMRRIQKVYKAYRHDNWVYMNETGDTTLISTWNMGDSIIK